jgi:hypothetical protein
VSAPTPPPKHCRNNYDCGYHATCIESCQGTCYPLGW